MCQFTTHLLLPPCPPPSLLPAGDTSDPRRVIVEKMSFVSDGRELSLDLTGDLTALKSQTFTIKEGCSFRIKVYFR